MSDFLRVQTTFSSQAKAMELAKRLVESRLAACVQRTGPLTSVYRWKGVVEISEEWRLEIKTRRDLFDEVVKVITEVHEYDVPEIVATELVHIAPAYAEWMSEQLA